MLTAFAFWTAVRKRELFSGCGPFSFTAMAISFPKRVNCTAILAQRLNFLSFLNSKALPIFVCFILDFRSCLSSWPVNQKLASSSSRFAPVCHRCLLARSLRLLDEGHYQRKTSQN